jgi:hypothetical protein
MGYTDQVAQLHGGMAYPERDKQVAFFRQPISEGGAKYLVATNAAGEGINLQFCWLMINYDVPWNPARLEQRMGRIHRFGQQHDPVIITNLVAGKTREGRVLKTLLDKLELIRQSLSSDKVFDVVGRIFEGVSLKHYMEKCLSQEGAEQAIKHLEGKLTPEQVQALEEQEKRIYETGGDVKALLPQLNAQIEQENLRRLLPGYVRRFLQKTLKLVHIGINGDVDDYFSLQPLQPGSLDWLSKYLEIYPDAAQTRLTVYKPQKQDTAIFLHPGEVVFEHLRQYLCGRFADAALRGGIFIDAEATEAYFIHIFLISILRQAESSSRSLKKQEVREVRLIAIQDKPGELREINPEYLTLLQENQQPCPEIARFVSQALVSIDKTSKYLQEQLLPSLVEQHQQAIQATLPSRRDFLRRGYDYQEAELAAKRSRLKDKANAGDSRAKGELTKIKKRQQQLEALKEETLTCLEKELTLVTCGETRVVARALVIPSAIPEDKKRQDKEIEMIAVRLAWLEEEKAGATVRDVSTPAKARLEGLKDNPGFDLLSRYPDNQPRMIEVKGRALGGEVEITENEWMAACNLRASYWLYVVFHCASRQPQLIKIQDPFGKLIGRQKISVIIKEKEILHLASQNL